MSDSFAGAQERWTKNALDAFEQFKGMFERNVSMRVGRGDVRAAIVRLLSEGPMHGYQLIQEIERRSNGAWKPSPGSVYPTLQLLADEGLVSVHEADGRKSYALTEAGAAEAADGAAEPAPWQTDNGREAKPQGALAKAGVELARAATVVARTGTEEQVAQATAELENARRALYALLAKD